MSRLGFTKALLLDKILELLGHCNGLSIIWIAEKLQVSEEKIRVALNFLIEFGFVVLDESSCKARIAPVTIEFLELPQQIIEANPLKEPS